MADKNDDGLKKLVLELIDCIDSTGGVIRNPKGLHEPVADPMWIDIGELYIKACNATGKKPEVAVFDGDDNDYGPG